MLLQENYRLRRSSYSSLSEYLNEFKLICDEMEAIDMPLFDKRKTYWCPNDLGDEYAIFTTSMISTPCSHSQMLITLSSFETEFAQEDDNSVLRGLACGTVES